MGFSYPTTCRPSLNFLFLEYSETYAKKIFMHPICWDFFLQTFQIILETNYAPPSKPTVFGGFRLSLPSHGGEGVCPQFPTLWIVFFFRPPSESTIVLLRYWVMFLYQIGSVGKILKNRKFVYAYVSEYCASFGTKEISHFWITSSNSGQERLSQKFCKTVLRTMPILFLIIFLQF